LDTFQGGYEVMTLNTGQSITRHRVTELPIPEHVIERVEALAKNDGFQPHVEPIFRTYALIAGVEDPQTPILIMIMMNLMRVVTKKMKKN
jgi:hypothetical protein